MLTPEQTAVLEATLRLPLFDGKDQATALLYCNSLNATLFCKAAIKELGLKSVLDGHTEKKVFGKAGQIVDGVLQPIEGEGKEFIIKEKRCLSMPNAIEPEDFAAVWQKVMGA